MYQGGGGVYNARHIGLHQLKSFTRFTSDSVCFSFLGCRQSRRHKPIHSHRKVYLPPLLSYSGCGLFCAWCACFFPFFLFIVFPRLTSGAPPFRL